jgi:hypothetical protein
MNWLWNRLQQWIRPTRRSLSVAEVLSIAISQGYYAAVPFTKPGTDKSPFMCIAVSIMRQKGIITKEEEDMTGVTIMRWIASFKKVHAQSAFLIMKIGTPEDRNDIAGFVKNKGIPFYKARIRELEDRANGLSV